MKTLLFMVVMSVEIAIIKLSKGHQFSLPAKSRKKHRLKPGQEMKVIDLGTEIIIQPIKKNSLKKFAGKFKERKGFSAVDEHDILVSGFD